MKNDLNGFVHEITRSDAIDIITTKSYITYRRYTGHSQSNMILVK